MPRQNSYQSDKVGGVSDKAQLTAMETAACN